MTDADARIDEVAPRDVITLDRGSGEQAYQVVHKDATDSGFLITVEADDGETFAREIVAGTAVKRSLEAKWESSQSPTPQSPQQ